MITQLDQFKALKAKSRATGRRPKILAIASGKGGVGKSHLSLNLAYALSSIGSQGLEPKLPSLLVDADAGMSDLHILMGKHPKKNWGDFLHKGAKLDSCIELIDDELAFLAGFNGVSQIDWMGSNSMLQLLNSICDLGSLYSQVILDLGAGINDATRVFTRASDFVLFVLTPELTSLADAYGAYKTLLAENPNQNAMMIVNRVKSESQAQEVYERFMRVSEKFLKKAPRYLGCIHEEEQLERAAIKQTPLWVYNNKSRYISEVKDLAQKLQNIL